MYETFNATDYTLLYTKYLLSRPEEEFVGLAGDIKGKRVVDLCCGLGRIGQKAAEKGCHVIYVDNSPGMVTELVSKGCDVIVSDVSDFFNVSSSGDYDVVFCRQAINYWFCEELIAQVARVLKKDGGFIFNTFNEKPSDKPTIRTYTLSGDSYAEVYQLLDTGMVFHVQMRQGYEPHISLFRWVPPDEFARVLNKYFDVRCITDKRTDLYVCTKRWGT